MRGGTEDEQSLRQSRAGFERFLFRPRGLCDVSVRSQTVKLFGRSWASPLGIAPTELAGMVRHQADLALLGCDSAQRVSADCFVARP